MKTVRMLTFVAAMFLGIGCCTLNNKTAIKFRPSYVGVDPFVKPYVDEYMDLSRQNNIHFLGKVTIGLTKMPILNIIGLCHYGHTWREIDLDKDFLTTEPELRRKILIFHELTHCYCQRSHDYGKGIAYPGGLMNIEPSFVVEDSPLISAVPWCIAREVPGYLLDGCPLSIMHPYILEQACIQNHYEWYIKEMFERCIPY